MQLIVTQTKNCLPVFMATLAAMLLCMAAGAQAKFSTVINELHPTLNEYVQVEYTVENAKSVENISPPSFKSFRLIQGPVQSSGMSVVNGAVSQFKSVSFILQPLVKGRITIPGAAAVVDGKTLRSNTVTIEVGEGGTGNSSKGTMPFAPRGWPAEEPRVSEEYVLRPGEKMSDKIRKNIFVLADINKTTCYEGEPIMATFKLCSRLRSESTVLKRPSLNGFSVYDMIEPEANHPTVETIGGKTFNVHVIRKTQLFPLQSGTYTIDPVELSNKASFLRTAENRSVSKDPMQRMMDEFMTDESRGEIEEQSFSLASKPVEVTVKPLPEAGRPPGFNGAVGKFTIQSVLENREVAAGDPVTIKVQIAGQGNFTVINAPSLSLPAGMEGYEPVVKETVNKALYPLNGTKLFTYTFTAHNAGTYSIPAIAFSYFDPSGAGYKTIRSDSFSVNVRPAAKRSFFSRSKALISPASSDWKNYLSSNILGSVAIGVIVIALIFLLVSKRQRKAVPATVSRQAIPVPVTPEITTETIEPLQKARLALQEGRSQEFYGELNKAVWNKIAQRMQLPATELSKLNVVTQLRGKGVNGEVLSQLEAVLNACEIALYTPVHSMTGMQLTLENAEELIRVL